MYETELLEQFADTDATAEFFTCLDHQLNKVNQFFRTKEKEFLERADSLKNQMEILIELKNALVQKRGKGPSSHESKEEYSVSGSISCDEETEQGIENSTCEVEAQFSNSPRSCKLKKEDRQH